MNNKIIVSILILAILICLLTVYIQNNSKIQNIEMLKYTENNTIHLPENIYGKWIVDEYVNCSAVGRDSDDDYIGDTLEIQKEYIVYNDVKMKIEEIEVIYDSMDYWGWQSLHYFPKNFMSENDVASYYEMELKNTLYDKTTYLGIIFTDKGDVYIKTSYACLLGKAVKQVVTK